MNYRDGFRVLPVIAGHDHGGKTQGGAVAPLLDFFPWRDEWKEFIIASSGGHYKVPEQTVQTFTEAYQRSFRSGRGKAEEYAKMMVLQVENKLKILQNKVLPTYSEVLVD